MRYVYAPVQRTSWLVPQGEPQPLQEITNKSPSALACRPSNGGLRTRALLDRASPIVIKWGPPFGAVTGDLILVTKHAFGFCMAKCSEERLHPPSSGLPYRPRFQAAA